MEIKTKFKINDVAYMLMKGCDKKLRVEKCRVIGLSIELSGRETEKTDWYLAVMHPEKFVYVVDRKVALDEKKTRVTYTCAYDMAGKKEGIPEHNLFKTKNELLKSL